VKLVDTQAKPTTADVVNDIRIRIRRRPELADDVSPMAARALAELRERLPNIEEAALCAVLVHASSVVGTQLLAALAREGIRLGDADRMDQFVLMTANVLALAGERLFSEIA
jgi:hypothetical protein